MRFSGKLMEKKDDSGAVFYRLSSGDFTDAEGKKHHVTKEEEVPLKIVRFECSCGFRAEGDRLVNELANRHEAELGKAGK